VLFVHIFDENNGKTMSSDITTKQHCISVLLLLLLFFTSFILGLLDLSKPELVSAATDFGFGCFFLHSNLQIWNLFADQMHKTAQISFGFDKSNWSLVDKSNWSLVDKSNCSLVVCLSVSGIMRIIFGRLQEIISFYFLAIWVWIQNGGFFDCF